MKRWLVTLKSHAEGPADVLCVDVRAVSPLAAIREVIRACRGMGSWAVMTADGWPRGVASAEAAIVRLAAAGGR